MPPESDATPLDDPWRWKLRLFASTDLVGSTAFKAARGDSRWAPTFKEFFSGFPQFLDISYAKLPANVAACSEQLTPWKFSGDEILFWAELSDYRQSAAHILAFKRAVHKFPAIWADKNLPLRLKATAWLAGFPVTNTEIQIGWDRSLNQSQFRSFGNGHS